MTIRSFPNIGQSCPSHIDQQLILCQLHVTLTIICISYFTFLRIVSYKPRYSHRKDVIVTCENLKDIRNIRHRNMYTFIPRPKRISSNFNQLVLITISRLAKLTTYNKFILLLFFITNKFDEWSTTYHGLLFECLQIQLALFHNIDIQMCCSM